MTERQRTVALLIDYDNLQICHSRDAPGTQLDLGAVIELAQSYGRVIVARAYAEWNLLSERLAVYKSGIEPAFAPVLRPEGSNREGKSLADTVMVSDGVDLLWTHQPDVLVLVTSDKDMIPLARLAKQRGALVVVLGSDLTAVPLLEMANEFVTYRHLIRELGRPEEKIVGRVREEPRARRPREAAGTREISAAFEASLREPRVPQPRSRQRPPGLPPPPVATPVTPTPISATSANGATQDEEGTVVVTTRRRRRRGGRGRRGALLDEQTGAALGTPDDTADDGDTGAEDAPTVLDGQFVEEPAVSPQLEEHELPPVDVPDSQGDEQEVRAAVAEPPPTRRRVRSRARREPEPSATPEPAEPSGPDRPGLRPWERWPEPSATAEPPSTRVALQPGAEAATTLPLPSEVGSSPGAEPADPSPSPETTEVTATADPAQPEPEAAPAPARRRRTRKRPAASEAAPADASADGE